MNVKSDGLAFNGGGYDRIEYIRRYRREEQRAQAERGMKEASVYALKDRYRYKYYKQYAYKVHWVPPVPLRKRHKIYRAARG